MPAASCHISPDRFWQFDTPIGFFHQILLGHGEQPRVRSDVKKGGLFPIVHGVRALALERHIEAVNSFARIEALSAAGALERDVAAGSGGGPANTLMELRLRAAPRQGPQRRRRGWG